MHPELQLLEQRYRALVDEVSAGHVGVDDAMVTMSGLVAVDASGAMWTIDPYSGQFTRALPGMPAAPADPSEFAERMDYSMGPPSPGPAPASWDAPSPVPVPRSGMEAARTSRSASSGIGSVLSRLTHGRGRVVAVAVAAVLAVAALVMLRPSPQEVPPDAASSATASPSPTASATATASPSPTASPSKPPALPSAERRSALVRTLSSGDRPSVVGLFAPGVNTTRVLLSTASIAGAVRLGFAARPGEVSPVGPGRATLVVTLSSASGDLQSFRVPLAQVDGVWLISGSVSPEKE